MLTADDVTVVAGIPVTTVARTLVDLVCGWEVDAWWPHHRIAVELDGGAAHRTRHGFQRDRVKGNALALAGILLLRFTHADLPRTPTRVVHEVRAALAAR